MSWYGELLDRQRKKALSYMQCFHRWVQKNHPEIMDEWKAMQK